ncbi:hypothetical protein [Actinoplanes sp. NPDC020271]|uniref:hypothetical protein n=1 Tax=Actinoplanes sp. NPDC020271 TaxID=3363896 RepID=UPI003793454D
MTSNARWRLVAALVALGIGWLGWLIVSSNTHSRDELVRESRQLIQEYSPQCDGKVMRPGDNCIAWGRGSDAVRGTYEERVQRFSDENQPEDLARGDKYWRWAGYVLLGIAGLLLLSAIRRMVVVLRTPAGRRAVAGRHNWVYVKSDPMGAANAHLPAYVQGDPAARDIVTGQRDAVPFQLFSYLRPGREEQEACVVTLPVPVPRMVVTQGENDPFSADTGPEARAFLIARFGVKPKDYSVPAFAADGNRLVRARAPQSSPARIERFVDETVELGRRLVTALTTEDPAAEQARVDDYRRASAGSPATPIAPPATRPAPLGVTEPQAPIRARIVCTVIGAAALYGGVSLVLADHPVWGTIVSLAGALFFFWGLAWIVSSVRVRRGRPRFAAAHATTFQRRDADLITRLGLPILDAGSPGAAYLASGQRNSREFHVFEYAETGGSPGTAFAVRHPTAGLPLLSMRALGDRRKESSEEGRLLLTDQVIARLDEVKAGTFFAAGDWIVGKNDDVLAPTSEKTLSRLDALARAADILTAEARRRVAG